MVFEKVPFRNAHMYVITARELADALGVTVQYARAIILKGYYRKSGNVIIGSLHSVLMNLSDEQVSKVWRHLENQAKEDQI
ncbi:MAG: hypothetical protein D6823_12575 [Chloroflexi bacterium]|jgi:hypothetical protein|nr:MAG: hypothetical protein D6823_12575 [Chloroflexota bacterium]